MKTPGKTQRGYQDIDVLAVNDNYTFIVSVTANLNDKVRFDRDGKVNKKIFPKTIQYFDRVESYLAEVEEYRWLIENRGIRRIIAFLVGYSSGNEAIEELVDTQGIELLSILDALYTIEEKVKELEVRGLNPQNDLIRLAQVWSRKKKETQSTVNLVGL